MAFNGSQSIMCNNINFLFHKYGIIKDTFCSTNYNSIRKDIRSQSYIHNLDISANVIRELLEFRDTNDYNIFTKEELNDLIEFLCTK